MLNRRKFLKMLGQGLALSLVASAIPSPLAAMIPKESEEERMKRLNPVTKIDPVRTRVPASGWRKINEGVSSIKGTPYWMNHVDRQKNLVELINETNLILSEGKYV